MNTNPMVKNLSGTYLFISFDLVNSTSFKLHDPHWPPLFNRFFDYCRLKTKSYFPTCRDWKMVGDEILFYMPVKDRSELSEAPQKVFSIMQKSIAFINENSKTKGILSVKSVVWAAYMREQRDFTSDSEEINYLVKSVKNGEIVLDFLGPHIDTGFRLGSFANQGKLVVGARLAALLTAETNTTASAALEKNLRIAAYEKLKGVWNGRRYPIVWYHEFWDRPDKMFLYDEKYTSALAANILENRIAAHTNIGDLQKVFTDLFRQSELTLLCEGMEKHRKNRHEDTDFSIPMERLSELHLVALCINEKKELLVGLNRSEGKWDFGCSSLQMYTTIETSLKEGYGDDFGIDLLPIDGEFPPIATYSFSMDRERLTIPGIMFLARVQKQQVSKDSLDPFVYTDFQWISRSEIYNISPKKSVPGFHRRAEKAFATYAALEKKERATYKP
ncbi:MAG: hypothetical protein ACQEQ4_08110 [Fibrobacterota bacterium]